MMFDSVLVKVSCSEELLYLHTISRRHKSPYRFAILRDTLGSWSGSRGVRLSWLTAAAMPPFGSHGHWTARCW